MQAFASGKETENSIFLINNNETETKKIIKTRILLVEDTPIIQKVYVQMLESLGCEIDLAKNGDEALSLYQTNNYDLVFLDLGLPDMDGVDVCKSMRNQKTKIPIIILTAHGISFKKDCITAGANCFLQKPASKTTLKQILDVWIHNDSSSDKHT